MVPLTASGYGGMVRVTTSPGWTAISSLTGVRLPPMGSARKRSTPALRRRWLGMVNDFVELPVARPRRTLWPPLTA